jgi:NDP-sugar pyrophosphorylase family protein
MKAILLAAGEGKRMRPLTIDTPKAMVEVLGKPLLYYIIENLPDEITELIIVVGYKAEAIKGYFGVQFKGRKITYVIQEKPLGTAHALFLCRSHIAKSERFLFVLADDLHSKDALTRLITHSLGVLVTEHDDPRRFGVVVPGENNKVLAIEEKPEHPKSNLVVSGVYVFDDRIFDYEPVMHPRLNEYFIPDIVEMLLKDHEMVIEKTEFWHPIGYPHDIDVAEKILSEEGRVSKKKYSTPVILIAGGKGTRMPEDEKHLPKCLVGITGKPMLQRQIEYLHHQGFFNITLSLGYKADLVIDWLKQNNYTDIKYVVEVEPLGTGGGIKLALSENKEPFIAINCDDLADVNLTALMRHSSNNKYNVLSIMDIDDASTFGLIECDEKKKICAFKEKDPNAKKGLVNIGHYYLQPNVFDGFAKAFSIEKDIFPKLAATGNLVAHKHAGEYWVTANNAQQLRSTREHFEKLDK